MLGFLAAQMPHLARLNSGRPHADPLCPNITNIEKRRHRGEAAKGEKEDTTSDLLLKHPNETFATYVRNS
jgi:hypothetical protein